MFLLYYSAALAASEVNKLYSPPPIRQTSDTHLYITFPPSDHTQALARMGACVYDAKAWLCDNGLEMNDIKSQAIVIRSSNVR